MRAWRRSFEQNRLRLRQVPHQPSHEQSAGNIKVGTSRISPAALSLSAEGRPEQAARETTLDRCVTSSGHEDDPRLDPPGHGMIASSSSAQADRGAGHRCHVRHDGMITRALLSHRPPVPSLRWLRRAMCVGVRSPARADPGDPPHDGRRQIFRRVAARCSRIQFFRRFSH